MKCYSDEFKEKILEECSQVGNIAMVARRYNISQITIHNWIKAHRKNGSIKFLPKAIDKRIDELEKKLEEVSTENERLKREAAEKELELAILRDLRDRANPR
jgi:transposase-like protein